MEFVNLLSLNESTTAVSEFVVPALHLDSDQVPVLIPFFLQFAQWEQRLPEHKGWVSIRTYQNAFGRAIEQTWSMSCVIGSLSQEKILNGFLRDYSRLHNCAGIGRRNDGLAREVMALVSISLLHRSICWS